MIHSIIYDENNVEGIFILSRKHLLGMYTVDIIKIIIRIVKTVDLDNKSIELEESIVYKNNDLYITTCNTICQAFNMGMNKLQLSYILNKWFVYNLDRVSIQESSTIEELVNRLGDCATVDDMLNILLLTKGVLECLECYKDIL